MWKKKISVENLYHIGDIALLSRTLTGVLASRLINACSVVPALDWAVEQAGKEDATIISGFQSALEKKILRYLLRGKCRIVLVLARTLYKQVPPEFEQAIASRRMLVVSVSNGSRTSAAIAQHRNSFIAEQASELVFISLHSGSSLNALHTQYKGKKSIVEL